MRILRLVVTALLAIAVHVPASAQTYPSKPGQIIVPFAAGGITDILARALSQKLSERWGERFVIVNRPGANGQIGTEGVARAPADGYTLLVAPDASFTTVPYLSSKVKYTLADFEPVSGLGFSPHALVVPPDLPVKTFADFIGRSKQNPGEIFYGTFGVGTSGHLNFLFFEKNTGAKFTPVHYSGASPAIADLLGNHIKAMTVALGLVAGAIETGQLKALALGSDKRLDKFPDVPVIAETIPGFEAGSWYALFAPKGTPAAIVDKLAAETQAIFNDPAFEKQFLSPNFTFSIANGPKDLRERIRKDSELWRSIIEDAKVSVD